MAMLAHSEKLAGIADEIVLVLDFGSQFAQLIARRVREQNVYCEIVRHDITPARVREIAPKGLILSGGPASVYETRRAALRSGAVSAWHSGAWHLLRDATFVRSARRQSEEQSGARIRPGALQILATNGKAGDAAIRFSPASPARLKSG